MTRTLYALGLAASALLLFSQGQVGAEGSGAKARVADLAWMAGRFTGEAFAGEIEELWGPPLGGSVVGLVRLTKDGATHQVEMLLLEEDEAGVVLRLQRFGPGFEPRDPKPVQMRLVEVEPGRVVFSGIGESDIRSLTYRRPSANDFRISVTRASDESFELHLSAD